MYYDILYNGNIEKYNHNSSPSAFQYSDTTKQQRPDPTTVRHFIQTFIANHWQPMLNYILIHISKYNIFSIMNNYTLLIGKDRLEVDLDEKVGIALSKVYEDLNDPSKMYGEWSKTIRLPMTSRNNKVFDNLFRPDQAVTNIGIDPRKKIEFILFHNQEFILTGFCKIQYIENSQNKKEYSVTLYSTIADVINDLKLMTFSSKDAVDPKYVLRDPLNCTINRSLVKNCWEQTGHCMDMEHKGNLDFIGFIPTYQGKYPDFSSNKIDNVYHGIQPYFQDYETYEVDEHYTGEFRSYYQQPYVWVDGLFGLLKERLEAITDYKFNLDPSWFNAQNPYWTKTILTCPTLFDKQDETYFKAREKYALYYNQVVSNTRQNSDLSNSHKQYVDFNRDSGTHIVYNRNRFRAPEGGMARFSARYQFNLFAAYPDPQLVNGYARLRDDNNLFIEFRAVDAYTLEYIPGAVKKFMFYSNSTTHQDDSQYTSIDLGIASRNNPVYVTSPDPDVVNEYNGYCWAGELDVDFDIVWDKPYYIIFNQYSRNNGDPFESALGSWVPRFDFLWSDFYWNTTNPSGVGGHYWYMSEIRASIEEATALRSNSKLTMDRIWQLEKTPFEILLDYVKMFRLVFDVDEDAKTVTLMSRDRYFNNYTIENWDRKLDRTKDFKVQPINFDKKFFNFKYKEAKGQRNEYYQDKYDANYGAYKVDTGYEFNTDSTDVFTELTPSMVTTKKQTSDQFNTLFPSRPNFVGYEYNYLPEEYYVENDAEGKNAGNSGAFYFRDGRYRCDSNLRKKDKDGNGYVWITDDTERQIISGEYCWCEVPKFIVETMWLPAVSPYCSGYAFQFQQPKETYYNREALAVPSNTKYIYDAFWKKYMDERYSVQTKVVDCYVYLTAHDYLNFKFNKFVVIENILYMVNKISDFNLTTDKATKVQLVQVSDIDAYRHSGISFPYLYTAAENFSVRHDNISDVEVFSSTEWQIDGVSPWIWAEKDNNMLHIRAYDINYGYDREAEITLSNLDGLTVTLTVYVAHTGTSFIHATPVSLNFGSTGGTKRVAVWSDPQRISVVSKSVWCNATITQPFGTSSSDSRTSSVNGDFMVDISVSANILRASRTGQVTLSNGYDTVTIGVMQQGSTIIGTNGYNNDTDVEIDDRPERMLLNAGEAVPVTLDTYKEMKLNSVQITNGLTSTLNADNIDNVRFTIQPEYSARHLDEGITADGGFVTMETVDGELVRWNYNLGEVKKTYNVCIHTVDEMGYVTVDGTDGDYMDMVPTGKTITFSCTPNDSYIFRGWNDGDANASRTITVNSDINLYPIFVENILEVFTVTNILSNCKTSNSAQTAVGGTSYKATISPYNWYTVDGVSVVMDGVNITTEAYRDGSIYIPEVHGNIVITVSGGWGGWDYVWSCEEGNPPIDFDDYNNGSDLNACGYDKGSFVKGVWVHTEGKFVLPDCDNIELEMICGFVEAPKPGNYPSFNFSTTDGRGFTLYYDQTRSDVYTDIFGSGQTDPTGQKFAFSKEKTLLRVKNNGKDMAFEYGNTVNVKGVGLNTMVDYSNYVECRNQAAGCDMWLYAVRIRFNNEGVNNYSVNISSNGNGSVQVNGVTGNYSNTVSEGTSISVTAIPNANYQFLYWSDGSQSPSRTLNITTNTTLTATFGTALPANNELWYWTNDGQALDFNAGGYNRENYFRDANNNPMTIVSNTLVGDRFVVTFSGDLAKMTGTTPLGNFNSQHTLTRVVLPSTVTLLGGFFNCDNLTSVENIDNITEIGGWCFQNCTGLVKFRMPDSVVTLGSDAFNGCTSLTEVHISSSLTSLPNYTFTRCTSLQRVEFPDGVTTIGDGCFGGCTFTEFVLPDSVTTVGGTNSPNGGVFGECDNLSKITISQRLTNIGTRMFSNTPLTSVDIPDSVTEIGFAGFGACDELTTVFIGSGVTAIKERAFISCNSLNSIYITATTPPSLETRVFEATPTDGVLHVPSASVSAYTTNWLPELPSGWTVVGDL